MMAALTWGALAAVVALALAIVVACGVGACLPRHHVATRTRLLGAPRAQVWALISEPKGYPAWRSGLATVAVEAGGPRLRWREGAGADAVSYELMESSEGARQVVRIADDEHRLPYGGRWIYELEDAGAGTRISITEEGEVSNVFFRFVSRYLIGHGSTIERYLDDLASAVQSRGVPGGSAHR